MRNIRRNDLEQIVDHLSHQMMLLIRDGRSFGMSGDWIRNTILETGVKTTAITQRAADKLGPEIDKFINKEGEESDFRNALYYAVVESLPAGTQILGDN